MILQWLQRFLTDEETFMILPSENADEELRLAHQTSIDFGLESDLFS